MIVKENAYRALEWNYSKGILLYRPEIKSNLLDCDKWFDKVAGSDKGGGGGGPFSERQGFGKGRI